MRGYAAPCGSATDCLVPEPVATLARAKFILHVRCVRNMARRDILNAGLLHAPDAPIPSSVRSHGWALAQEYIPCRSADGGTCAEGKHCWFTIFKEGWRPICGFLEGHVPGALSPRGEQFEADAASLSLLAGLWGKDLDAIRQRLSRWVY